LHLILKDISTKYLFGGLQKNLLSGSHTSLLDHQLHVMKILGSYLRRGINWPES